MKWEQIRNSQSSTDPGSEPTEVPSEIELWVQANYNKKGRVYGLGSEGVKLKHLVKSTTTSRDRDPDPDVRASVTQLNSELNTMAERNRHLEEKVTLLTSELSGLKDIFREFMRAQQASGSGSRPRPSMRHRQHRRAAPYVPPPPPESQPCDDDDDDDNDDDGDGDDDDDSYSCHCYSS